MPQLTKGMYGSQFQSGRNLFGLRCAQMHVADDRLVHNGGWYNVRGEQLGWGDLAPKDFLRISRELEDGELFIVLSERNAFGNFVTEPGAITGMPEVLPDALAPGIRYVAEKCRYIIGKGVTYLVEDGDISSETIARGTVNRGLWFRILTRDAAKQLLGAHPERRPHWHLFGKFFR
jgi:hypothetical protein